ncbi:DUF5615 family PIN-like protein [Ornithinimicrobium faecis]|uniref:DUF5615 family PIN-like protein n=1 Tax=Ornithinimicrobium faecis TaxID=2934158 RepID=UPI002117F2A2|nr:DUF5615 family PIN-like protein [Ornithinimicrobium sp. HY1745]
MKFLLDNNLSPRLIPLLAALGHSVEHVRDHSMHTAPDDLVLAMARERGQVLISADTDFGTLLARSGAAEPSVILIRRSRSRRPDELASLLRANLEQVADDLNAGSVVVVTDTDLRVRRLPIPPGRG